MDIRKMKGSVIAKAGNKEILNKYLKEISNYKPLSREEEIELFKRISENGDQSAIDKIHKHNSLFVVSVAKKYASVINSNSIFLEDLISDGNIGLAKAIPKFDYTSGNKFISYAVWWIKHEILNSIQKNVKLISIPKGVQDDLNKMKKKKVYLEQKLGHDISAIELFDEMMSDDELKPEQTLKNFENILNASQFETSLDKTFDSEEDLKQSDLIASDSLTPLEIMVSDERIQMLYDILKTLPSKIYNYIIDYYGLFDTEQLNFVQLGKKYDRNPTLLKQDMEKHLRWLERKYSNQNKIASTPKTEIFK